MPEEISQEKKRDLIEAMRKERGSLPPLWSYLAEKDYAFLESYNGLYEKGLTEERALPAKTKELIVMGILAFRGLENAVYEHAQRTIQLGTTKQELL